MVNAGQVPPDYSAPIGQFRLLAQDTTYVSDASLPAGEASYGLFSDAEIDGYISMYSGLSLYRGVAAAYLGLAGRASMEAKLTKDYDLQVDLTKRAISLQAQAQMFIERANAEDELSGATALFQLTPQDTTPSLAEVSSLPMEQWAFLEGIDLPTPIDGLPPQLWGWS